MYPTSVTLSTADMMYGELVGTLPIPPWGVRITRNIEPPRFELSDDDFFKVREPFNQPGTSVFEMCPAEIKLKVMEMLPLSDLQTMMRISSSVQSFAQICLYGSVVPRVSQHWDWTKDFDRFHIAGKRNLRLVRNLTIVNSAKTKSKTEQEKASWSLMGEWRATDVYNHRTDLFNRMVLHLVIDHMPLLKELRWFHTYRMRTSTFGQIVSKRAKTITSIETGELIGNFDNSLEYVKRTKLSKLELRTAHIPGKYCSELSFSTSITAIRDILRISGGTLKHLVLGDERLTWAFHKVDGNVVRHPPRKPLDKLLRILTQPKRVLPSLTHLDVIGVEISTWSPEMPKTLNFHRLARLSLESCIDTENLLRSLSARPELIALREFKIRQESPSDMFMRDLDTFLASFSGLEVLSVLLDNVEQMMDHNGFMKAHGDTLKALVWEGRKKNKGSLPISLEKVTDYGPPFLETLCNTCPNLEELSIALDMRLPYDSVLKCNRIDSKIPFKVLTLPRLKTLHSRFVPATKRSTISREFFISTNKMPITHFLDYGCFILETTPRLELIAVGAASYADRYIQDSVNYTYQDAKNIPYPIFFDVRFTKEKDVNSHVLSPLGKHNARSNSFVFDGVEEVKQNYAHTRIFESYWLK